MLKRTVITFASQGLPLKNAQMSSKAPSEFFKILAFFSGVRWGQKGTGGFQKTACSFGAAAPRTVERQDFEELGAFELF